MANFGDLINIDEFSKRENFKEERWAVQFYCRDCKEIVEITRPNPKWYVFICKKCDSKNVAIWTEESLKERYKRK